LNGTDGRSERPKLKLRLRGFWVEMEGDEGVEKMERLWVRREPVLRALGGMGI
jgi:hypothetical protein